MNNKQRLLISLLTLIASPCMHSMIALSKPLVRSIPKCTRSLLTARFHNKNLQQLCVDLENQKKEVQNQCDVWFSIYETLQDTGVGSLHSCPNAREMYSTATHNVSNLTEVCALLNNGIDALKKLAALQSANPLRHGRYTGEITHYDPQTGLLHGRLAGVKDDVKFTGCTVPAITTSFKESAGNYDAACVAIIER